MLKQETVGFQAFQRAPINDFQPADERTCTTEKGVLAGVSAESTPARAAS
jgi:hypothetical protein